MSGTAHVRVLALADLAPGTMRCVSVADRRVLVAHVEGAVLAIDDRCPHEDASLSSGSLSGFRVKCPLHGSRFDLRTGAPLEEPADEPVRCYRTRVNDGWIEIAIDAPPAGGDTDAR